MGDVCVNPLPTLAFDPLLQISVWPQKPIFKGFYQKHDVFPENTMFSENREKHVFFSQGTTFLQVLEALGRKTLQHSIQMVSEVGGSRRLVNICLPSTNPKRSLISGSTSTWKAALKHANSSAGFLAWVHIDILAPSD